MRLVDGIGIQLNGFDLMGKDDSGVWWSVQDVEGLDEVAETTGETEQKDLADGGWITPSFYQPKPLVLVGTVRAPDRPSKHAALRRFNACLPKDLATLVVSQDGVLRHRLVRCEGPKQVNNQHEFIFTFNVQLVAPDPRLFSGDGSSPYQFQGQAFLPSTTGGLQFPRQVPFQMAASVVSGSVTVDTTGDAPPPVLARIHGPAVQPVIRDQDGGAMPLDITLDADQWLDVDLDARTIKINGTVNRRNLLRGPWITPRSGMVLSLDAAAYDPLTSMTVFWTDASY